MKNNNFLKILIIFLFIICIGIITIMGYFLYELYQEKNNENNEKSFENTKNISLEKENNIENIYNNDSYINSYEEYVANYNQSFKKIFSENDKIFIDLQNRNISEINDIYVDYNCDAYMEISINNKMYPRYGKKIKMDSEIANVFVCDVGNGSLYDIIMLKNDGTVRKVNGAQLDNGVLEVEEIEGVKNVVNVISYNKIDETGSGGDIYAFVDIYGNIIEI